jgi:hypothetical protein
MSDCSVVPVRSRSAWCRRRFAGAVACLLIVATSAANADASRVAADHAVASAKAPTNPHLRLVDMPLSIEPDTPLLIVVGAVGDVPIDGVVVVTAYAPVNTRQQVATIVRGDLPSKSVGTISIPVTSVDRDAAGDFVVSVPTQSATKLRNKLRLKDAGLYPLSVELRDNDSGETLAQMTTFIERRGTSNPSPVYVGMVFDVDSVPTLQPDGTTLITDDSRAQLMRLTDYLERTAAPATVVIRPELLDGLKRSGTPDDLSLLNRLAAAIGTRHELLAEPSVSLDPSAAAAAGLQLAYTDQLRLGEDQLFASLGVNIAKRSTAFVPAGIDNNGLGLLRGLGIRHVLLDQPAAVPQPTGTPTGEIGLVRVAPDQDVPALVADPTLQSTLHTPTDDPVAVAHSVLADLVALGSERDAELRGSATAVPRGVAVVGGHIGDIDPALLDAVMDVLRRSPHIALDSVDTVLEALERGTPPVQMRTVAVVNRQPIDLRPVASTLGPLNSEIVSFAGMLPQIDPVDPRPAEWRRLMEVYPADNINEDTRRLYSSEIEQAIGALRGAVSWPTLGHITIGGRASTIPFVLDNSSDTDLKVLLHLSSAKMNFPDGDPLVTVTRHGRTSIDIRVVARSGAEFPVTVQLLTPDGRQPLGGVNTLTVRASVLTGLGQVVTGALLVILASWWLQSYVRARRRRRASAEATIPRHPLSSAPPASIR